MFRMSLHFPWFNNLPGTLGMCLRSMEKLLNSAWHFASRIGAYWLITICLADFSQPALGQEVRLVYGNGEVDWIMIF